MKHEDLTGEQRHYYDSAWENLRLAFEVLRQKRRARAQEYLLEVRFCASKIPIKFTDHELYENIENSILRL